MSSLADVSYGVLGVMAGSYGPGFWLATIIAFSIFMLGAMVGHVRKMIVAHNFAPGNAGTYFWFASSCRLGSSPCTRRCNRPDHHQVTSARRRPWSPLSREPAEPVETAGDQ